jgi:asparagine synthase (glutamine-hydrolysing)
MACGLEGREPLLDHRLVEFAWRLPLTMKIRDGQSKWPLRQILYRRVPKRLVDRAKSGFGLPIADWLRGPLRPWAEDLLSVRRLAADGFFNADVIRTQWQAHLSGRRNVLDELWAVLMFQAWLDARDVRPEAGAAIHPSQAEVTLSCIAH